MTNLRTSVSDASRHRNTSDIIKRITNSTPQNPYDTNSPYYDLWEKNPYRNLTYGERSLWDKLGDSIGFRTKEDQWILDNQTAIAEYDAKIAQLKESDEYENAVSQANREREAGINPTLAGASPINAGESNGMPDVPRERTDTISMLPEFAIQTCGNIMKGVFSLTEKIQGMQIASENIKGLKLDNQSKAVDISTRKISNADSFRTTSRGYAMDELLDLPIKNIEKKGNDYILQLDDGDFVSLANLSSSKKYSGNLSIPYEDEKLNARYARYRDKLLRTPGFQAEFIENYNKLLHGKTTTQEIMTSPFFVKANEGEGDFRVQSELSEYCQNMLKIQRKFSSKAGADKAKNESDYQSEFDGTLSAQADNSGNKASIETNNRIAGVNSMWNACISETEKLVNKLSKIANSKPNGFVNIAEQKAAQLALISAFGMLSTMQTSFSPNFGKRSTYINNNDNSNVNNSIEKAVTINNPLQ